MASKPVPVESLWHLFQRSRLWRLLRRASWLRHGVYLALELRKGWREPAATSGESWDLIYRSMHDPWQHETDPIEQDCHRKQIEMLDEVREGKSFHRGLEIGCGEGLYSQALAGRCESLLAVDISPTAVKRAQGRQSWPGHVRFNLFDLRSEPIPGQYDLIVLDNVLETFSRRATFRAIREKLAGALTPNGYLLVVVRDRPAVFIENSWWGRYLIRGKWINVFFAEHPCLTAVITSSTEHYSAVLCRRVGHSMR